MSSQIDEALFQYGILDVRDFDVHCEKYSWEFINVDFPRPSLNIELTINVLSTKRTQARIYSHFK